MFQDDASLMKETNVCSWDMLSTGILPCHSVTLQNRSELQWESGILSVKLYPFHSACLLIMRAGLWVARAKQIPPQKYRIYFQ